MYSTISIRCTTSKCYCMCMQYPERNLCLCGKDRVPQPLNSFFIFSRVVFIKGLPWGSRCSSSRSILLPNISSRKPYFPLWYRGGLRCVVKVDTSPFEPAQCLSHLDCPLSIHRNLFTFVSWGRLLSLVGCQKV